MVCYCWFISNSCMQVGEIFASLASGSKEMAASADSPRPRRTSLPFGPTDSSTAGSISRLRFLCPALATAAARTAGFLLKKASIDDEEEEEEEARFFCFERGGDRHDGDRDREQSGGALCLVPFFEFVGVTNLSSSSSSSLLICASNPFRASSAALR